ncbi:DUF1294 domain-containing protein [Streptobacillus moniliformis]|uniref:DUF1294 domain-containing protein n=2 Tax=Streptobacillus moniliformis TaxID=34105 RepID=D1AVZ9_STRM9|nr:MULTISPECIES: DUF1294 domain-containing protein [Streptobacillus]ACZ01909.1 protein of unknown function DUF1294 [Streptobacillus moniliformis DSM 12112]AVL43103.1 DUF1294 domain-containing protein [Streptobacillus moniliformis]QXW65250.1 DUF1294 domain-containing protein [Streptobacillus moniliformis]SQA12885.1 Protein of uncharacterised function (DUF1294) [Streptobacillus moniliformis]
MFLLLTINLFAFIFFGIDKFFAINNISRISEKTLLSLSFLGPFGAIIGMNLFRHKTKKLKFKSVYLFLLLHLLIIYYLKY